MIWLLGVIIGVGIYFIYLYNRFIRLQNACIEGWSGIDVQLKRRHDLIPNLVEAVKGYAKYEKSTLKEIVQKRNEAMSVRTLPQKERMENQLAESLKNVLALTEAYPELKANAQFTALHHSLIDVEDELQLARRYYNATVRDLNTAIDSFPANLVAVQFGFSKRMYFQALSSEKSTPAVNLKNPKSNR